MNTYCLALNRRRKTNSIPGQSSPKISPFKYTAREEAPCELEGWRTKGNGSLECHVDRLPEGDGPSPARARASTSCDPQGATLLSAAGCTTAPARWIPPHRRPPSQPHGLLQAFPEWWEVRRTMPISSTTPSHLAHRKVTKAPRICLQESRNREVSVGFGR